MNNKKYIFIGFGGLTYDLRNVLWRSRRLLFVRSLKHGINVRKISGNAVTRLPHQTTQALRASFWKYRESGDRFSSNKAFSELFSKIQLKDPKALEFFQNRGKFENRHFGLPPPLKK